MKTAAPPMWVDPQTPELVEAVLRKLNLLAPDETIDGVEDAGVGNMNVALRVAVGGRSLILKQSRPWVAKYPSIVAPTERIFFERRFYETVAHHPSIAQRMPRLLGAAEDDYVLVLEDLGRGADCTSLYLRDSASRASIVERLGELVEWLADLHSSKDVDGPRSAIKNSELRALNHEHVFEIPFSKNQLRDLDALSPDLAHAASAVVDDEIRRQVQKLGMLYLSPLDDQLSRTPRLLHGDFFPGSWLMTDHGLRIIDPEFCFHGPAEFDLGVLVAHLRLARIDEKTVSALRRDYAEWAGTPNDDLVEGFAAVEVLRRLFGVAQLPIDHVLEEKMELVEQALLVLRRRDAE